MHLAAVVELADTPDLGSGAVRRGSSSLPGCTNEGKKGRLDACPVKWAQRISQGIDLKAEGD
jgi:hypothetical protein